MRTNLAKRVFEFYRNEPWLLRLFVWLRWQLTFFETFSKFVPRQCKILDYGCGHGLFAVAMALKPSRQVIGYDPDKRRIASLAKIKQCLPNLRFTSSDLPSKLDVITVIDVLYLLPPSEKKRVLKSFFASLSPGGILILKINDTRPILKYWFTYAEEWLMTKLGITYSKGGLYFWSVEQYKDLFNNSGFKIVHDQPLGTWHPQTHHLLIAIKPRSQRSRAAMLRRAS